MKKLFPGYYKKTESDIRKIWENGIILFDTNVLLNLYRYSDATRETLLELIGKFSKQIFLPHQSALEYNRNRYEVIAEQEKAYKEFLDKISQIQKDLQSTSKPPLLTAKVDKDLNNVFEKVSLEVEESIKKYCAYLQGDPIYDRISDLFESKITDSFDDKKLLEIYKEGEERFKMKIPPGFEDEKTKEGNRKYGDLVLWKQVIELAKVKKKDIILVTDERKIDWWWKIRDGRNMGPRQELVEEIKREASVEFYMYSSERFLSYVQTFLKEKINQQALNEIQAMKKAELEEMHKFETLKRHIANRENKISEESLLTRKRIDEINDRLIQLRKHNERFYKDSLDSDEVQEYLHSMGIHEAELDEEKSELIDKLEQLQKSRRDIIASDDLFSEKIIKYFRNHIDKDKK